MANPDWLESLGAGAAGAVSGALFDLPEWIAKQLDRKDFEAWKERNKDAYNIGNTAGTIGSAFIPVGGIVGAGIKGASKLPGLAKLAGVGEKIADIGKVTKDMNFGQMATKLGAKAALESGVGEAARSFANEEDLGTGISNTLSGAALGGLTGGVLGAGLSKAGNVLGKLREGTQTADLTRMLGPKAAKGIRGMVKNGMGVGTNVAKSEKIDNALNDIQDVLKKVGARGELDKGDVVKTLTEKARPMYAKLDEIAQNAGDALEESAKKNAIAYNSQYLKGSPELQTSIDDLSAKLKGFPDMASKREFLQDAIKKGYGSNDPILMKAAQSLRSGYDDAIDQLAEASGDASLKEAGKVWKTLRVASDADMADKVAEFGVKGTGSPTFEKGQIGAALGLGGLGAAGGAATSDWSDPEKLGQNLLKTALAGAGGAALSKTAGSLKNIVGSASDDALKALIEKGGKTIANVEKLGQAGAGTVAAKGLVAGLDNAQKNELVEKSPEVVAHVAQTDKNVHRDLVKARLKAIWDANYADQYPDPKAFDQFLAGAEQASRGFDPERTAALIYPDAADREAYLNAYRAKKAVDENLDAASEKTGGFLGIGKGQSDNAKLAEAALTSAAADSLKNAGIDAKTAKDAIKGILSGGGNKKQKLLAILAQYNPQGFAALQGAGLV